MSSRNAGIANRGPRNAVISIKLERDSMEPRGRYGNLETRTRSRGQIPVEPQKTVERGGTYKQADTHTGLSAR